MISPGPPRPALATYSQILTAPLRERPGYVITLSDEQGEDETLTESTAAQEARTVLQKLTPSERRVALLVAEGMSNDEIAEQLRRSRRTVEFQLNAIYRKLGMSRRAQLARALS